MGLVIVEKYVSYCHRCKKEKEFYIAMTSRKRGVRIRCCTCGRMKQMWKNFKLLKPVEDETNKNAC